MRIARLSLLGLSLLALAAPSPAWASRPAGAGASGGDAYCPRRPLRLGDVVVPAGRCYLVAVLRNHRGTFLAFLPAAASPDDPAERPLTERILYLVPVRISDPAIGETVLIAMNAVHLVEVRAGDDDDEDTGGAGPHLIVIVPDARQDLSDTPPPEGPPPAGRATLHGPMMARPEAPPGRAGAPPGSSLPSARASDLIRRITTAAREVVGTPYVWGGASRSGVDCSGLVYMLYSPYVPDLPRTSYGQFTVGTGVARGDLRSGDLVFFDTDGSGASHVGIYTGDGEFVTVSSSAARVIIARLDNPYWAGHYIGARRLLP